MRGLIVEKKANLYQIKVGNQLYEALARGKFKKEGISPVVGDWVQAEITDEENKKAVIEEIEERQVYVKRPKLANITQMVFIISSKDPKPDLLMLDKQLAFAEFLGIRVVIILNKIDLDKSGDFEKIKEIYQKIGYSVLQTNARTREGIDELEKLLKDNINAFSGNSGVGKSTLINAIFEKNMTQEGEISKRNRRGKNTTTAAKLYEIDKDTYIADTPGFSTFDISEITSNQLENYFIEWKENKKNCEFVGCTHAKEENCGIKQAIEKGEINLARYERFCKIYQELKNKEEKKW